MYLQSFRRYERKYRLNRAQLEQLLPILRCHMDFDEFCPNGETYEVQDLYFDTQGRDIVRACALEPGFKQKLRVRFYASAGSESSPCFVEYKKKAGKLGGKRRAAMTASQAQDLICRGKLPASSNPADQEIFAEILRFIDGRELSPAARIQYRRLALFGKDNRELRATIDCALNAQVLMPDTRQTMQISLLEEGSYLLEIKIPGAMPLWLSEALSSLHLFPQSHSKYGRAWQLARRAQLTQLP